MNQLDGLRRYLEAATTLTQITRGRAEELVRELVASGELERARAQEWIEDLLRRSREASEALVVTISAEVDKQLGERGLKNIDLDDLAQRVAGIIGLAGSVGRNVSVPRPWSRGPDTTAPGPDTNGPDSNGPDSNGPDSNESATNGSATKVKTKDKSGSGQKNSGQKKDGSKKDGSQKSGAKKSPEAKSHPKKPGPKKDKPDTVDVVEAEKVHAETPPPAASSQPSTDGVAGPTDHGVAT